MADPTTPGEDVSFDDVLAGASARTRSIKLCLRGDLLAEIERLDVQMAQAAVADAAENREAEAPKIAKRIIELTEEAQRAEVEFTFQPIGRTPWREMILEHPPTDEQKSKGMEWNPETLPVEAMGKSCISPKGATPAKFRKLADDQRITDAQWDRLWGTCYAANSGEAGGADIPFSARAYALARGTGTSSA